MNLKPELLTTLINLGVDKEELVLLGDKMLSAVTNLQANLAALNSQIESLNAQREAVLVELNKGLSTVSKLGDM